MNVCACAGVIYQKYRVRRRESRLREEVQVITDLLVSEDQPQLALHVANAMKHADWEEKKACEITASGAVGDKVITKVWRKIDYHWPGHVRKCILYEGDSETAYRRNGTPPPKSLNLRSLNLHWLMTSSTNHVLENHSGLWSNIGSVWLTTSQDIDTANDTSVM